VDPFQPDLRDAQIKALEAQCAVMQREILALKTQLDPASFVIPPERSTGGAAPLEVYWKSLGEEFTPANSYQTLIPLRGFVSTRYVEIPANAASHLRIDTGNQPGLWLFSQLTLNDLGDDGAVLQPPVSQCEPSNQFAGLAAASGAMILPTLPILPTSPTRHQTLCKILAWDSDPQLLFQLPDNPRHRTRILGLACAALDPAHAIMAHHGQQLLTEIAHLQNQLATLKR